MINQLKRLLFALHKSQNPQRTYQFTMYALELHQKLKPNSRKLLMMLIRVMGTKHCINDIIIKAEYYQLGFDDRSNFHKAKKELIKYRFIFNNENEYLINPTLVNCYTSRQYKYLLKVLGIKEKAKPIMKQPKIIHFPMQQSS